MAQLPKTYERFREEFPQLAEAYDSLGAAAHERGLWISRHGSLSHWASPSAPARKAPSSPTRGGRSRPARRGKRCCTWSRSR